MWLLTETKTSALWAWLPQGTVAAQQTTPSVPGWIPEPQ